MMEIPSILTSFAAAAAVLASEEVTGDLVVVSLGDLGLNGLVNLGFGFGLNPDGGTGEEMSSSSILAKMSSIKLFSVVDVVVVGLKPGGKNFEISSCSIVSKTLAGFLAGVLNPDGNSDDGTASSVGILAV